MLSLRFLHDQIPLTNLSRQYEIIFCEFHFIRVEGSGFFRSKIVINHDKDILLIHYIGKTMSIVEVNVQLSREFIATSRNRSNLLKITIFLV